MIKTIKNIIENAFQSQRDSDMQKAHEAFQTFLESLESGDIRAAYPKEDQSWVVDADVKQCILYGFKLGHLIESVQNDFQFCDKHNLWPNMKALPERAIRIVPGGTTVRRGACLKNNVTVMPPSYINIGAFVDSGSMVDSHVTIGSCAQIGKHCHISAAAQIGGVLEPVGASPVIIEDDVFVGGNSGIYEGIRVHSGAVIAAGTLLTRSTPLFDLVNETIISPVENILHVPQNAVVIPGSRPLSSPFAVQHHLSAYAPIIIKYRDEKTSAAVALETALR